MLPALLLALQAVPVARTTDLVEVAVTSRADGRAIVPWSVGSSSATWLLVLVDEGGAQAAWSNLLRVNAP